MQSKLARWSSENKGPKFDRLLRLLADATWLAEAARITLASRGARTAGVDGIDKQRLDATLPEELSRIRAELLAGTYEPLPARRVYIPKASDKKKLRPLGIPSLRDRIVERAMLMAMEPIWESDFHRASFGFRPARSVHHAVRMLKLQQLQDGGENSTAGRWVVEGDLASYFQLLNRDQVLDRLLLSLLAGRVLRLIAGRARQTTREPIGQRAEEALDEGALGGFPHRASIDAAANEFAQRGERVLGQVSPGVVELEHVPAGVGGFWADFTDEPASDLIDKAWDGKFLALAPGHERVLNRQ